MKKYRHYEFLYEEEKFSKVTLQDQLQQAQQAAEDYKKQAERLEHKASKSLKELEQALSRLSELEHEKDSFSRELELLRSVEEQVKR